MLNSSQPMTLSPMNKRNVLSLEEDENDMMNPNQCIMRSSTSDHSNKRARYEPSWTLDNLCTHPCSPLASIDLETIFNVSTYQFCDKKEELSTIVPSDQGSLLNHHQQQESYHEHYNLNNENFDPSNHHTLSHNYHFSHPSSYFTTKADNTVFWNGLPEWQNMFHQPDSPPLPLSPSPPTIANNSSSSSSSSKSICSSKPKQTKSKYNCKKDKLKEESFDSYWSELMDKEKTHNVAGDSKCITLKDMCRKGLIREQDVIVYKRNFSACKVVVSKSMTVVKACGLSGISIKLDEEIFENFETPTALETKILDHHGKVTKDKRPNGNAFKSIRLIRAGKDMGRLFDIRKDGFGGDSSA